jgi:integrase
VSRERQAAAPLPSAWIFADEKGGPLRRQNFRRRVWEPLAKLAGVPGLRFHDLRHLCASLLMARNVHPRVVQSIVGHVDVGTPLAV